MDLDFKTPSAIEDSAGRLLMIGFEGEVFSNELKDLLLEVRPGGIILFKRNVMGGPRQVFELTSACQELSIREFGRPLFISIDEEGGPVRRLEPPFYQKISQRKMAERMTEDEVDEMAQTCGRELAAVGVNFNLAPVMDLSIDPEATFMYERSFGDDIETVNRYGAAVINGYRQAGIKTCAKHFPGIGDTHLDPHEVLPTVNHSRDRLLSREIRTFAGAIQAGVDAIMTSHINYPALDADNPATFSRTIITDMLREELNFKGLILTDDMEMGAIVNHYRIGPACVDTVTAGSDMVLICHQPDRILEGKKAIQQAIKDRHIGVHQVQSSFRKIAAAIEGNKPPSMQLFKEVFDAD